MVTNNSVHPFPEKEDDSQIGRLLRGSVDMHLHVAPGIDTPWRHNALESALDAKRGGLASIVLKSRDYPTAPIAELVSELVPDVKTIGSICLDYSAGGLNPRAVEVAANLGARVVWMPLFAARNSIAKTARAFKELPMITSGALMPIEDEGLSLIDAHNKLLPEVIDILKIVKDCGIVLATGHISPKEIFALVDKAMGIGIKKIVVTHCMFDFLSEEILTPDERKMLTKECIFMEHTAICILPTFGRVLCQPGEVASAIGNDGP